jgi:hypothetical protein
VVAGQVAGDDALVAHGGGRWRPYHRGWLRTTHVGRNVHVWSAQHIRASLSC